jgi:hypothetical protein
LYFAISCVQYSISREFLLGQCQHSSCTNRTLNNLSLVFNIKIIFLIHFKSKLKICSTVKTTLLQVQRMWRLTGSSRPNLMEVTLKLYFSGRVLSLCTRSCIHLCSNSSPGTILFSSLQITHSFQFIS